MQNKTALKILGVIDIVLGLLTFFLQITYWVEGYDGKVVSLSSGLWGGSAFFVAGVYACKEPSKKAIQVWSSSALGCGILMTGIFSYGVYDSESFTSSGRPCSMVDCDLARIITIVLLASSVLGVLVNGAMLLLARTLPKQPIIQYHPDATQNPGGNAGYLQSNPGTIYTTGPPAGSYPVQQQQPAAYQPPPSSFHQQQPNPSYPTYQQPPPTAVYPFQQSSPYPVQQQAIMYQNPPNV